jgi:hypothetical protein
MRCNLQYVLQSLLSSRFLIRLRESEEQLTDPTSLKFLVVAGMPPPHRLITHLLTNLWFSMYLDPMEDGLIGPLRSDP